MAFAKLTHVKTETDPEGASLLSFQPSRPFTHKAGQFGLWIVDGKARPFTIASAPRDEFIQLGTRLHSDSGIKRALSNLNPGDQIRILGPIGKIAAPDDGTPVVYLTQGIGITPARSLIREHPKRRQTLIHAVTPYLCSDLEPLVDTALFAADRSTFIDTVEKAVASQADAHFLVSGSTGFVKETAALLSKRGIDPGHIRTDSFIGLPEKQ